MKQNTAIICLSPVNGGMELASVKLARILSSNVNIFFIGKKDGFIASRKEHFENHPITPFYVDFSSNFSFSLIKQVRTILIENKIKNIIFLGASEMKSLYFATLGLDINFIIRQGSKKTTSKKDFLHKLFYSNVKTYVGNCDYMKQNIIDILPIVNSAKVTRIYSSLKLQEEVDFKAYTKHLDLIHVGRVHPGKGQFEAIKACEVLAQNSIPFTLKFLGDIQDKNYLETMQNYLDSSDIKQNVEFVGYTTKVKEYLQQSDVFIFPSLGEGMSNAIIEALGFGLIPIIYNDTSSPEFKTLGFHIHLTHENTVQQLQKELLSIAENLESEKKMAQENHEKALKIFAPEREKNEYLELLV